MPKSRREKGTTDDLVKVLKTSSVTMTSNAFLTYASGTGNYLDDIVVLALNGDTLEEETFTYNAGNEMTSQVVDGNTINYTYDQFGRMTKKTRGGYSANYYYHYGDKLTKVASNFWGEGTVTYTYGGDQKRRSRAVSGGDTIKYRYDQGWSVLNEENGSGTLEATYFQQPGRQIGTVLATSAGSTASSGTWNYYFQDVIGSTRGLWDQDGVRIGKYEYSPFGGKYADHGEDITRKFTGHDWDSEARLYYTAYRYYSPDSNRWLTRDPLGMVDGPNVYAYVVNNPVTMFDPDGRVAIAGWLVFLILAYSAIIMACAYSSYVISLSWGDQYRHAYFTKHCFLGCEFKRCVGIFGGGRIAYAMNWFFEAYSNAKRFFQGEPLDKWGWMDNEAAHWGATVGYKSPCTCVEVCTTRYPEGVGML